MRNLDRWTLDDAAELYGIRNWGGGYFNVSEEGEVVVNLQRKTHKLSVSLSALMKDLKEQGFTPPVLLRFRGILDARLEQIHGSFNRAIESAGYQGLYRGVYPIKVNQQQQVLEEIAHFGQRYHHGFEAGSKGELIAAMAYMHDPEAYLICNGYKDEEFVDLALQVTRMGMQVILVVEMPDEWPLILRRARALGVRPNLGVRLKLATRGGGHWTQSGGDRSVFGLNVAQVLELVDALRIHGYLDCLKLLHYHVGSQVPKIRTLRAAASEAMRVYASLIKEGAPMGLLDVGGGLAVDYDGSKTSFECSGNYDIGEYCTDLVEEVMGVCEDENVPHPTLISESGRALTAYYSVLLFDILDAYRFTVPDPPAPPQGALHDHVCSMQDVAAALSPKNLQECYNDALHYRDEVRASFLHGDASLRERAYAEQLFWHIMTRIARELPRLKYVPEDLQKLEAGLADVYYGNFSLFQSLPDSWAIDQLFPIMPIHRLKERPGRMGILSDITCDCDGKIDKFIDLYDVRHSLPLHELRPGEQYLLGAFLVGAYQETLGDLHNLFGDTHVMSIDLDLEGRLEIKNPISGDTVSDVLSYVEYTEKDLIDRAQALADRSCADGHITDEQASCFMKAYQEGLAGYTYFEN